MVDKQSWEKGDESPRPPYTLFFIQICTDENDDTGGININNIGGVFIVIFGGIFFAVITLCVEFTILKFGWTFSCTEKSLNEDNILRSGNNFYHNKNLNIFVKDFCGTI